MTNYLSKKITFAIVTLLILFIFSCKDHVTYSEGYLEVSYPWQIFHDYTGKIDSTGYTNEEKAKIAKLGVGIWTMFRVLRDNGAQQIRDIMKINPAFIPICYTEVMAYPVTEPGESDGIYRRLWQIFKDHPARHLNDRAPVLCWPPPSQGPPSTYWHSTLPATGGRSFNYNLMNELLDTMEEYMKKYPNLCKGMFLDFYTTYGPYVHPSEQAIHGPVDMDGDGVAFENDPKEKKSWIEWEREFSKQLKKRFGPAFIEFPNGSVSYPGYANSDEELARNSNGSTFENFPGTPWGWDGAKAMEQLYLTYSSDWFSKIYGHLWIQLVQTLAVDDWSHNLVRMASMIFMIPYSFIATSESNVVFEDFNNPYPETGEPVGKLVITTEGNITTYSREYENGAAEIVVDQILKTADPIWIPK